MGGTPPRQDSPNKGGTLNNLRAPLEREALLSVIVAHRAHGWSFNGDHGPVTYRCVCGWVHTEPNGSDTTPAREAHVADAILAALNKEASRG